jgi:HK97 family phage major capsid protein
MREGTTELTSEERSALRTGWVDGKELRAQGVATGAAGGYLVPPAFRAKMVEAQRFFSSMRDVAEVITTETGATLPWPTADDTANVGAILGENTQVTEQDVTLGQADIGAYTYTSKLVRVSLQLLNDAAFDFETWLAAKLGQRIGRAQNAHFTTGTGTAQPEGVQTNAVIGKTGASGQTTSVTYDDLIDLIHSVDPAYRNSGRARFMLNDATLAAARKLKDAQGRPLWEPSVQVGVPDGLLGYGYTINQDMPAMAAGVKSILFGDFAAGYLIRDVQDVQLLRLSERYADYLQVGFLAFARTDGTPQDTAAYRAYANAAS